MDNKTLIWLIAVHFLLHGILTVWAGYNERKNLEKYIKCKIDNSAYDINHQIGKTRDALEDLKFTTNRDFAKVLELQYASNEIINKIIEGLVDKTEEQVMVSVDEVIKALENMKNKGV